MSGNDLSTLHKFNGWRCDSCGELITSIDAGWVEWLSSEGDRGQEVLRGLRLVHHGSVLPNGAGQDCRYDRLKEFRNRKTIVEGLPLERFVGPRWPHDAYTATRSEGTFMDSQRALILQVFEATDWVIGGPFGAAARLGLKRTTLVSKMKKLGLYHPRHRRLMDESNGRSELAM